MNHVKRFVEKHFEDKGIDIQSFFLKNSLINISILNIMKKGFEVVIISFERYDNSWIGQLINKELRRSCHRPGNYKRFSCLARNQDVLKGVLVPLNPYYRATYGNNENFVRGEEIVMFTGIKIFF